LVLIFLLVFSSDDSSKSPGPRWETMTHTHTHTHTHTDYISADPLHTEFTPWFTGAMHLLPVLSMLHSNNSLSYLSRNVLLIISNTVKVRQGKRGFV